MEKRQINATNVTMPRLRQVNWKNIWKCTVEKSQINAANLTLHVPSHSIWEELKIHREEKSNKCNQCDYASYQEGNLRRHLKTHSGGKRLSAKFHPRQNVAGQNVTQPFNFS